MKRSGLMFGAVGAAVLAVVLGGCREEEQGRVLIFEKGSYAGKPDTPLSAAARRAARARMANQGGLNRTGLGGGSGGGASSPPDVRAPSGAGQIPIDALRRRGRLQGFN